MTAATVLPLVVTLPASYKQIVAKLYRQLSGPIAREGEQPTDRRGQADREH